MSLITAAACNSALEPQVLEISQSINSLRGTHFERLPEVILKYNTVHDSIEADEPHKIAALKASVREHVSDGDTMFVAATVVMYNPQDAAGLIMRHCIDVAKSEASLFEKRARISDIVAITRFVYAKGGEPSSIGEWEIAIDNAVAPIDGKATCLTDQPSDEINTQQPILTISDTSSLIVNATVDERNISYIKPGMMVDLDQWGNAAMGIVESVSLSSTVNNGVATYPMVVSMDNADGMIQVNSNIQYSLIAKQNDNCLVVPIQCVHNGSLEDGTAVKVVYVGGERPDNALEGVIVAEEIPEGFWPVEVEIGISDNYNVEIKSGVEEGTEVFTQTQVVEAWG